MSWVLRLKFRFDNNTTDMRKDLYFGSPVGLVCIIKPKYYPISMKRAVIYKIVYSLVDSW